MALDEEEIEDDVETISLQRKKRDKTQRVYLGETKRLFQEFELAEIVDSPFWDSIISTGQKDKT